MKKRKINEADTPTYKRFLGPLDEWLQASYERPLGRDANGTERNFRAIEDLFEILMLNVTKEESREVLSNGFDIPLEIARELAQRDEETRWRVDLMISSMAQMVAWLVEEAALTQAGAEQRNNILVQNAGKPVARAEAIRRAWVYIEKDTDKRLRSMGLAVMVYSDMARTEHSDYLPETKATLCRWFREEGSFPEYIHARGRPKNGS